MFGASIHGELEFRNNNLDLVVSFTGDGGCRRMEMADKLGEKIGPPQSQPRAGGEGEGEMNQSPIRASTQLSFPNHLQTAAASCGCLVCPDPTRLKIGV
jgi:hypothetical protein